MNKIVNKFISTILVSLMLLVPATGFAQFGRDNSNSGTGNQSVDEGLGYLDDLFGGVAFDGILDFLVFIINILLVLSGAVAVLFVIIGGFQYITSAGNAETASQGKKAVINAIIGIVVIILSYMIINVIVGTISGTNTFLFN